MRTAKFAALFIAIALLGLAKSVDFPYEEGVLVLGEDNFEQAIKHYEHILVEFYAPWCGHCKKLAPEYAKAAQALNKNDPPLALAKVDATVHKDLASKFGVQGFPTLKLFTNGTPSEYTGGRTEAEIVAWMKKKTGPASKALNSASEVESFHKAVEVAIVYFGDNAAELEVFQKVARSDEEFVFGHCSAADCLSTFNVKPSSVVLFKKFDEKRNDFTDKIDESALSNFVKKHSSPLVMKFDEKSAQLVFGKSTPGLFFYRDKNAEKTSEYDNILAKVASQVQGKIQVVVTDIKEGLETRLAEYIGVTSADLPTVRIHDTRNDLRKFNMEGPITEDNVLKFVKDWESGNLKPSLKSEEIPAEQNEDVYVLVGKSFNDIVMDPKKDVLVEFYAPWCGHCKKLAPIYEELAKNLKHNQNLVIAKMDATANEVDGVSVQGFPTIKFWPAGNKTPIDFNEERTVEGFTKFLEKHSTNKVAATKEEL